MPRACQRGVCTAQSLHARHGCARATGIALISSDMLSCMAQGQAEHAKDLCGKHGYWGAVFQWQTYHVALIACLEGTVKNSLLYWTPLIIYSLVGACSSSRNTSSR